MKVIFISSETDLYVGLKMAGIFSVLAKSDENVLTLLKKVEQDKDIGLILLNETSSGEVKQEINKIKMMKRGPLILEIPKSDETVRSKDFITKYISDAIGVKL